MKDINTCKYLYLRPEVVLNQRQVAGTVAFIVNNDGSAVCVAVGVLPSSPSSVNPESP